MLAALWQDIRYATRSLKRTPGFTCAAVLTLALGIGANTAIFSVINGVLLKPLPYANPDALVGLWHRAPGINIAEFGMAPSMYVTYREQNRVFEDVGLWDRGTATVTGVAQPEQVQTLFVTERTLGILRVSPLLGRRFTADDDVVGNPDTVILTYDYWLRRFGGEMSVLGRQLTLNGRPREVIGVLPRTFRFLGERPALLLPLRFPQTQLVLGNFNFQGVARLKPGVTIAEANTDVARMLPIWASSFPPPPGFTANLQEARLSPDVRPLKQDAIGNVGSVLWIVMGTLGVVLLIACANVANLQLVRAEGRRQELGVRAALGAGRGRLAKELLVESLALALASGVLGLLVAGVAIRLLTVVAPAQLPRLDEIAIDTTVLLFALGISAFSGVLFSLLPVIKYASPQLAGTLVAGGRTQTYSRERHRARSALVVVQVALALVLLISAGLLIRTFQSLRQVNPGFTAPHDVQTFRIAIPQARVPDPEHVLRMEQAILDRIAAIPGVVSASFAVAVPMDWQANRDPVVAEDKPDPERQFATIRTYNFVAPGFFRAIGTPVLAGRDVTWDELYERRPVALVSASLARELWGEPRMAVGKRIRANLRGPWREVIGVVGDVSDDGTDKPAPTIVYWPVMLNDFYQQDTFVGRNVAFAVRSSRAGTSELVEEIQQAVWAVNKDLPLAETETLGEIYDRSMARTAFTLVMLGIAGSMALLLGLVGIYAVMSSAVSQRTREIAIRIAVGARQGQVTRQLLKYSLALTIVGVLCGLAGAAVLTRLLQAVLFGVTPLDPATFVVVPLVLSLVAMLAAHIPVRRATSRDPMAALRAE